MSRSSKTQTRDRRKKLKKARRQQMRELYAKRRSDGSNLKSRRYLANRRAQRRVNPFPHSMGNCGNIGCGRCFPDVPGARITKPMTMRPVVAPVSPKVSFVFLSRRAIPSFDDDFDIYEY